ncbi:uncharacterized protein LOC144360294 [Saccoglossus kowalevskii]
MLRWMGFLIVVSILEFHHPVFTYSQRLTDDREKIAEFFGVDENPDDMYDKWYGKDQDNFDMDDYHCGQECTECMTTCAECHYKYSWLRIKEFPYNLRRCLMDCAITNGRSVDRGCNKYFM